MTRTNPGLQRSRLTAALLAALLMPAAGMAFAQDTDAEDENEQNTEAQSEEAEAQSREATELDRVVVTGSRISRAQIEGPSPVVVITSEELERQGFSTVYGALNTLTQFTGSVQNELTQNGFTPNASFLNLRGLGPGYQLVLINGRRAADYPLPYNSQSNAVDLSNIPSAAIERIEILTGGASAIYGSDAVAGVVNIVMKTNYEGDLLSVRGGTTTRGGGDTARVQWVGGKVGPAWSLTYAFEYLEREAIFARQREFMDSYLDDPSVEDADVNPVEGLLLLDGFTSNRLFGGDPAEEVCGRFSEFDTFVFEESSVYTGPRCGYFGYPATQAIRNSDSNLSGYLYGTWDFGDGLQAFVQFNFTDAQARLASNTQFWSSGYFFDPTLSSAGLPAGAIVTTQRIFTPAEVGGLGAQTSQYDEQSYDFATGLRGLAFDGRFDWEAVVSHAAYELEVDRPRFLANKLTDYFLGEQMGLDPYFNAYPVYDLNEQRYFNPIDAETFQSLNTRVRSDAESEVTQANLVFTGDLFQLPAGPLAMATVIEAATQSYVIHPDPRTSPNYAGDEPIYNLTSTGGGGDRDRYAFGLEFSIPVFSTLTASLAGRYDKYDDITEVDGAFTWSAGLEWRPTDNLLIRGTHATSFRAPDMHYVFADTSGFFTTVLDEYRCRRDGFEPNPEDGETPCSSAEYTYSVFGTRSGSTELEEERGESSTIGFVWDIVDNMSVSVDYYQIRLEGGVSDINTGYLLRNEADCLLGETRDGTPVNSDSASCQFFTGLVDRTGTGGISDNEIDEFRSVPFNQSLVETSGIDATWKYQLDTDRLGDFGFQIAWTHVLKLDQQEFPGEPIIDIRDHPQYFNFRSRLTGQVAWQRDEWQAALYGYRWGSLPNWAETGRIGSYTIWNVNVQKDITDQATIGLYVNNVFDTLHPDDDTYNSYPFFWRAYSPIGREIAVQFDYRFN